jgi:hypothetical protein
LAGELTLLNAKTPHEQWPDIVVLAGVGVINYAIQFPRKGLGDNHPPPAPGVVRGKPPPMYAITVESDALNLSIAGATNEMRAFCRDRPVFDWGASCIRRTHWRPARPRFF